MVLPTNQLNVLQVFLPSLASSPDLLQESSRTCLSMPEKICGQHSEFALWSTVITYYTCSQ